MYTQISKDNGSCGNDTANDLPRKGSETCPSLSCTKNIHNYTLITLTVCRQVREPRPTPVYSVFFFYSTSRHFVLLLPTHSAYTSYDNATAWSATGRTTLDCRDRSLMSSANSRVCWGSWRRLGGMSRTLYHKHYTQNMRYVVVLCKPARYTIMNCRGIKLWTSYISPNIWTGESGGHKKLFVPG